MKELRQHVRNIISKRIYESVENGYEDIMNDFINGVKRQNGIKSDNGGNLTELEGIGFVFGDNYDFEINYDVISQQYVKGTRGDGYYIPYEDIVAGKFDFVITGGTVYDKEGNVVCDFDDIAEQVDGGYERIKDWFAFDDSVKVESEDSLNEVKRSETKSVGNSSTPIRKTDKGYVVGLKIMEALNLSKIQKHGADGFVVVSANRSNVHSNNKKNDLTRQYLNWCSKKKLKPSENVEQEYLKQRNAHADDALLKDIRNKGYSYSMVYGGYHGKDGVTDSYEPSFVIYNHKKSEEVCDSEELAKFAVDMCKKYKQDSVYIQKPNETPNYYDANGSIVNTSSSKNVKFNRDDETFYTTTKRKKKKPQRFTADIVFEGKYYKPALSHEYVDRMRRNQYGEIFLG